MMTDTNIGRVFEGKYEVTQVLGMGGMGAVYKVRHKLINRDLALKLLHSEYASDEEVVGRFQNEATATTAIGHEHIVDITDMGVTDTGELFIVMEYLEGEDLAEALEREVILPYERICKIMAQALSALAAAHEQGIIHRDLKPGNIFLAQKGGGDYVKIVDFGISKVRANDEGVSKGLTRTGQLLGTPSYMSPEQARGDADITAASDIYSMGVILYEMATGALPFHAESYLPLLLMIMTEEAKDPLEVNPTLSPVLADIIKKAMAKEPEHRFASVREFYEALTSFAEGEEVQADLYVPMHTPRDLTARVSRPSASKSGALITTPLDLSDTTVSLGKGRSKLPAIFGAVLGLGAIAFGLIFFLGFGGGEPEKTQGNPAEPASGKEASPPTEKSGAEDLAQKDDSREDEAPPQVAPKVKISLDVSPEDAQVTFDGKLVGKGDSILEYPMDDELHLISVTSEGFVTKEEKVFLKADMDLALDLKKIRKKSRRDRDDEQAEPAETPEPPPAAPPTEAQKPKKKREIDEEEPW